MFKKEFSHKFFDNAFEWEFSKKIMEIYLLLSLYKENDELNQDKIQIILKFLINTGFIQKSIRAIINPAFELYFKYIMGLIDNQINTGSSEIIKSLMGLILQYLNHQRKESISKEYKQKSYSKVVEIMIEMLTNISKSIKDKKDHFKTAGDEYHKYHVFLDSLSALIQNYEVKFKEIKLNTPLSPNNSLVAVS